MKKGLLLLAVLFVGSVTFAQNCGYKGEFNRATKQVLALQRAELPGVFYFDAEETNPEEYVREMTCFQERVNLFYAIEDVYRRNPDSYNAAFNYANAMMCPIDEIEGPGDVILPSRNADEALKALKKIKGKNANDVEVWQLIYKAYEYKMFGNRRVGGLPIHRFAVKGQEVDIWQYDEYGNAYQSVPDGAVLMETIDNLTLAEIKEVYANDFPATRARLEAFENMERLNSEYIYSDNYKDAALMCEVLGQSKKVAAYFSLAKKLEQELEANEQREPQQRQEKIVKKALEKDLYSQALKNMYDAWK